MITAQKFKSLLQCSSWSTVNSIRSKEWNAFNRSNQIHLDYWGPHMKKSDWWNPMIWSNILTRYCKLINRIRGSYIIRPSREARVQELIFINLFCRVTRNPSSQLIIIFFNRGKCHIRKVSEWLVQSRGVRMSRILKEWASKSHSKHHQLKKLQQKRRCHQLNNHH